MDQEEMEGELLHHWHGYSRSAGMLEELLEAATTILLLAVLICAF